MKLPFLKKASNLSLAALVPTVSGLTYAKFSNVEVPKPRLIACEYTPWPPGEAQVQWIQKRVREYRLGKGPCSTVLKLGDYSLFHMEAPDVPQTELRAAVRWQIKDMIDFHMDDAVVDVFEVPPTGASSKQHNLNVIVSKTAIIQKRVDLLHNARAELSVIDIPELVLENIAARLSEDEGGVAFVYLEAEQGLILISKNSTMYLARPVDLGYQQLHESLKEEHGDRPGQHFDRLVLEVQRSLDYYDRYFGQAQVSGIVIAPTPLDLPGLADYLQDNLGIRARMLDLTNMLETEALFEKEKQSHCLFAIGAALRKEATSL